MRFLSLLPFLLVAFPALAGGDHCVRDALLGMGAVELLPVVNPHGRSLVGTVGDTRYVSIPVGDARMPARVTRLWTDARGWLHFFADVYVSPGHTVARELTSAEIADLRLSAASRTTFTREAAPPPAPLPKAPVVGAPSALARAEIEGAIAAYRANPAAYADLERGVYGYAPSRAAIPQSLEAATRTAESTARFLAMTELTVHGEIVTGRLGGVLFLPGDGWFRAYFSKKPIRDATKVYASPPFAALPTLLPTLAKLAELDGAGQMKFGMITADLARPDRVVVHFGDPAKAARYALDVAELLRAKGLGGDRVPFTYEVAPGVSMGVDPADTSWRGRVSALISEGASACRPPTGECIEAYLRRNGVDTSTWLPAERAQAIMNALRDGLPR